MSTSSTEVVEEVGQYVQCSGVNHSSQRPPRDAHTAWKQLGLLHFGDSNRQMCDVSFLWAPWQDSQCPGAAGRGLGFSPGRAGRCWAQREPMARVALLGGSKFWLL